MATVKIPPVLRESVGGEKQVAARLDLSHATTHQYVSTLYRHFGVRSRAQLLAHIIKRMGRGEWRQFLSDGSSPGRPV